MKQVYNILIGHLHILQTAHQSMPICHQSYYNIIDYISYVVYYNCIGDLYQRDIICYIGNMYIPLFIL